MKRWIIDSYKVLSLFQQIPNVVVDEIKEYKLKINNITENEICDLITKMNNYREEQKYKEADEVRQILLDKEILVKGNMWDIIF